MDSCDFREPENLKLNTRNFPKNVKLKLQSTLTVAERVKIISLIPGTSSVKKVTAEFSVSQYNVRKGRALQKTCSILPEVEKKKG
jgi:hypothetical protein